MNDIIYEDAFDIIVGMNKGETSTAEEKDIAYYMARPNKTLEKYKRLFFEMMYEEALKGEKNGSNKQRKSNRPSR